MIETIIFNNEVLEFEIPNNLNELKLLKIQLETQLSLLRESLKHSRSPDQTRRIEKTEIAPIKAQVKAVNLAIKRFYSLVEHGVSKIPILWETNVSQTNCSDRSHK